jgi:hypothetical protein
MVVLCDEGKRLNIARSQPHERFARFKFKIDLVPDPAAQPVHFIGLVGRDPDSRVAAAAYRINLGAQYGLRDRQNPNYV